jgi:amino acid adenylation domain-containing protein
MSDLAHRIASLSPEQRALFERLLAEDSEPEGGPDVGIARHPRGAGVVRLPLSFAQERLWFLDQLDPGNAQYNIPMAVELRGRLDVAALERSLDDLARRHETLRTTIHTEGDQGFQAIAPAGAIPLEKIDLGNAPEADRRATAMRLVSEDAGRPFDLARGPLVRAKLLRIAEDEHVLALNMHHVISDGWSFGVAFREVARLYEAHTAASTAHLSQLPVQYADFAAWQRDWFQGGRFQAQLAYWKERLAGAPAVLELPTDHPRPLAQTYCGGLQSVELPPSLVRRLRDLGRDSGVTLFMTLLAAYQALLRSYTGQDDIVVGSPIAGRTRPEIEGLIGLFVNTLALRVNLAGNPTVRELLARVREATLGAYENQDIPFEKLVEEVRPERRLSHTPLFQVMFLLQNVEMGAPEFGGLAITPWDVNNGTAKFDLSLCAQERGDTLRLGLTYNVDLFEPETIARVLGHFQSVLEAFVADPGQRLASLSVLTLAERRSLVVESNSTEADFPRDLCLHELIEAQARRTPDGVAVACEGWRLTYRELNARANQLARFLRKRGVRPETLVGLYVERSPEMMVGLLGILKSGAAYVPLDPDYPPGRLKAMLEDACAPLLVTQRALRADLPAADAGVVLLDSDWEAVSREDDADLPAAARPDNLAYVIFTSGSTGRPKGVQVLHRAVVNLLTDMQRRLRLGANDVFPALASFAFDMCIPELYLPLVAGAQVLIVGRDVAADAGRLLVALRDGHATHLHATPTTWRMLLEAGWKEDPRLRMIIGAEALPPDLAVRLIDAGGNLLNFYGPTETTVWSAVYEFRSREDPVCIGRPLANQRLYLLDRDRNPVPVGVAGEVYISGAGLARGYRNRPGATAEKFVPDPYGGEPGARMYRTGDLARRRSSGDVEFLGRADHQVKVRGFRIELGEIEAALAQHPDVRERVVVAREDHPGERRLTAYLVPAVGQSPTTSELRRFLQGKLPDYMVPSAFVILDALPLNANGKVDRHALPAPGQARPELEGGFVPPRDPVEEAVAGVWAAVLGMERVGVHDNFFDLGGHSLLVIRLATRLRDAFGVDLSLRSLFEAPTVAGTAAAIGTAMLQGASPEEMETMLEEINNSGPV